MHIYTVTGFNEHNSAIAEGWGSRRLFQTHRYLKERELSNLLSSSNLLFWKLLHNMARLNYSVSLVKLACVMNAFGI